MKELKSFIEEYLKMNNLSIDKETMPNIIFNNSLDEKFKDKIEFVDIKNNILSVHSKHPSYTQLFRMQEAKFLSVFNKNYTKQQITKIKYK